MKYINWFNKPTTKVNKISDYMYHYSPIETNIWTKTKDSLPKEEESVLLAITGNDNKLHVCTGNLCHEGFFAIDYSYCTLPKDRVLYWCVPPKLPEE